MNGGIATAVMELLAPMRAQLQQLQQQLSAPPQQHPSVTTWQATQPWHQSAGAQQWHQPASAQPWHHASPAFVMPSPGPAGNPLGPQVSNDTFREWQLLCTPVFDRFSSLCLARPLPSKDAKTVAKALFGLMCEWGAPRVIHMDPGGEFENDVFKELNALFRVDLKFGTADNHRGVGGVERMIRTARSILLKMLEGVVTLWDDLLPWCLYVYNTSIKAGLKSTPFAIHFGRSQYPTGVSEHFESPEQQDESARNFDLEHWLRHQGHVVTKVYPAIKELLAEATHRSHENFKKTHLIQQPFKIGTSVMAEDSRNTSKMNPKWTGPFLIKSITDVGTYVLSNGIHEITRSRPQLKAAPMRMTATEENAAINSRAPGDNNIWPMDTIVTHRGSKTKFQYLVKWRGHNESENTWEPAQNILDKKQLSLYWMRVQEKANVQKAESVGKRKRDVLMSDGGKKKQKRVDADVEAVVSKKRKRPVGRPRKAKAAKLAPAESLAGGVNSVGSSLAVSFTGTSSGGAIAGAEVQRTRQGRVIKTRNLNQI